MLDSALASPLVACPEPLVAIISRAIPIPRTRTRIKWRTVFRFTFIGLCLAIWAVIPTILFIANV
jgi:hypothetical protein